MGHAQRRQAPRAPQQPPEDGHLRERIADGWTGRRRRATPAGWLSGWARQGLRARPIQGLFMMPWPSQQAVHPSALPSSLRLYPVSSI